MLQIAHQQILPLEWQDERSFENFKRLYEHMKSYFPTATET